MCPYNPITLQQTILTENSTTMDSGPNGDSFLAPRLLPDPDEGGDYRWPSSCTPPPNPMSEKKTTDIIVTHPIRIRTTTSLWSSAACPTTTNPKPLFAIGTSNGLHTLTGLGSHWAFNKVPLPIPDPIDVPPYIPNRDRGRGRGRGRGKFLHNRSRPTNTVTSVEWLSDDVIAAGLKDSTVFLHDVRSGGSASRLRHNGPVARICRLDEWRVVVGGVHSVSSLSLISLSAMVRCMFVLTMRSCKCTTCVTHRQTPIQIPTTEAIRTTGPRPRLHLQNPTSFSKTTPQ